MRNTILAGVFAIGLLLGCSENNPRLTSADLGPLSVDQWREMSATAKYEFETFERLKAGDPKLKNPKRWKMFMKNVIVPQRMKDIPTDYSKSK